MSNTVKSRIVKIGNSRGVRIPKPILEQLALSEEVELSVRGDQLVIVNVETPTRLTNEQRQLFEQLAKSLGSEVRPQERGFLDWLKETLGG